MFRLEKITSLDLPELAPYRTMRRSAEHEAQGVFIAEGEKVTRRLLESRFTVVSVVLPEKHLENFRPLLEARPETVTVYVAEKSLLETLVGYSLFQGVLSVGRIPPPASLDEILTISAKPQLFAAIDGLSNAENLGAVVRNCVAFGVQALLVGETCSSPYLRRSVRNSMGTIFQLPVWEVRAANQAAAAGRRDAAALLGWRRRCAICGRAASAASPRIRTRTKKCCRRRIFPAMLRGFRQRRPRDFAGDSGGVR